MRIRIKSFIPKKDLPFVAPQAGEVFEVEQDGEHFMIKTSDGQELALNPDMTDNEYFTSEIEAVVSFSSAEQLIDFVREQSAKVMKEMEQKRDNTVNLLEDILVYDNTLLDPFHDLLNYINKTYDDKYEGETFPAVDLYGLKFGGTKQSSGFNVGSASSYLKRYLTDGYEKSYQTQDLLKAIHFLLFELHSRTNEKSQENQSGGVS